MCGITAILQTKGRPIPDLAARLDVANRLQAHRGPDGEGTWRHENAHVGFAHRRLSIIDLDTGQQPMSDAGGNSVTYNGEIYNYRELRRELGEANFRTQSDTEVILHAYRKWGTDCVSHFVGMFAFALWDEENEQLFCARDRFGIKPFHYTLVDDTFYCASEAKGLVPFLPHVEFDVDALKDYLTFQLCLAGKTMFEGVRELLPGHTLLIRGGQMHISRYWQVYFELDWDHDASYFEGRIRELVEESIALHLRADVPVGGYVSGGFDSSMIAAIAREQTGDYMGFVGRFGTGGDFDESVFARDVAKASDFDLRELDITLDDFLSNIEQVVYHMDYPAAGPGSFPQYMVSQLAAKHRKVVLGGQGGDEIFGGYARYLIAYFEQCIKAAIDGTMHGGSFVVTYESIIPNLTTLKQYKPLLQQFWKDGLFEDLDRRYFRLIDRAQGLGREIRFSELGDYSPFETFQSIFHGENVQKESYFDLMTHFDFKTLLPALLQVEDRVSMAHGLESRVPLLYHPLIELAATIPADKKFKDGRLKHVFRDAMGHVLPKSIIERKDKMGFPVPLAEWMQDGARGFVRDVLSTSEARGRAYIDNHAVLEQLDAEPRFGRKVWGLLCLELWQRQFVDRAAEFRGMLETSRAATATERG